MEYYTGWLAEKNQKTHYHTFQSVLVSLSFFSVLLYLLPNLSCNVIEGFCDKQTKNTSLQEIYQIFSENKKVSMYKFFFQLWAIKYNY